MAATQNALFAGCTGRYCLAVTEKAAVPGLVPGKQAVFMLHSCLPAFYTCPEIRIPGYWFIPACCLTSMLVFILF
jgi:hypothetical protein